MNDKQRGTLFLTNFIIKTEYNSFPCIVKFKIKAYYLPYNLTILHSFKKMLHIFIYNT